MEITKRCSPKKPQGVDQKSAYLVGSGLASLSAAAFLIRNGQMKGENIHILEELPLAGGSLDGILNPTRGFIIRGDALNGRPLRMFMGFIQIHPFSRSRRCVCVR